MKSFTLSALILVACGIPKPQQEGPRNGLQYDVDGEVVAIIYETKTDAPRQTVDVQIQVNQHRIEMSMNADGELQKIEGNGAVLSAPERKAMSQAAWEFAKPTQLTDEENLEQQSLYLAFAYLYQAPENQAIPSRNFEGE
ncbi:hypothetical protein [Oligoflexus tunisiensis]|uniref:hypothetical protein n=1 Tax=Oligoflexus tunisiensis TaxID=708132 RepID=UPI00114CB872|nr:hypothetical protein [Oligoflexus tunisiensis]